jgi:proteasomal ATPase-associated factor 1
MRVKIWSADTGICPVTLTGHSMAVTDIAIVDLGKNIISCSKYASDFSLLFSCIFVLVS